MKAFEETSRPGPQASECMEETHGIRDTTGGTGTYDYICLHHSPLKPPQCMDSYAIHESVWVWGWVCWDLGEGGRSPAMVV